MSPKPCPECGTPEDEVPLVDCKAHGRTLPGCALCYVHGYPCRHCRADALEAAQRAPQLAMDEIPFAPPEVHLP